MAAIEVLVSIDSDSRSSEVLEFTEGPPSEESLLKKIQHTFSLAPDSISHLQIWTEKFQAYANLRNMANVQDGSKMRVLLKEKSPVPLPLPSPKAPPENQCETCFEQPTLQPDLDAIGQGAIFPNNRLWDKTTINVCFLNQVPTSWSYSGHKYSISGGSVGHVISENDILRLANHWSTQLPPSIHKEKREKVPKFVSVLDPLQSDIRIWFQTSGGCRSKVGTDALNVPKGSDKAHATMFLDLGHSDSHKEHSVMHEFGHALGLGHEHQRVVFWENIGKYFKPEVVKEYFQAQYNKDVASYPADIPGQRSEYDPNSIMHYCFDSTWLESKYDTLDKVNSLPKQVLPGDSGITDREREMLRSMFTQNGLAEEISQKDFEFVATTYYDHLNSKPTAVSPPAAAAGGNYPAAAGVSGFTSSQSPTSVPHIWLTSGPHFNALYRAAFPARDKWYDIGSFLELTTADLDSIMKDNTAKPGVYFREMLTKWFNHYKNCYLDVFVNALESPTVKREGLREEVVSSILEVENKRQQHLASKKRPASPYGSASKRGRRS